MICKVNAPPLAFRSIVVEAVQDVLLQQGFQLAYHIADGNELVRFARERDGQQEKIVFGRRLYDEPDVATGQVNTRWADNVAVSDEVDAPKKNLQGTYYPSRHYLFVDVYVNSYSSELLRNGKAGFARKDEGWWHFKDEADLRHLLRDKVLPLLLTAGLQSLDDIHEDIREGRLLSAETA